MEIKDPEREIPWYVVLNFLSNNQRSYKDISINESKEKGHAQKVKRKSFITNESQLTKLKIYIQYIIYMNDNNFIVNHIYLGSQFC